MSRRIILREIAPGIPVIEENKGASIKITSDGIIEIEGAVYVNGPMRAGSHLRVKGMAAFLGDIEPGVKITVTDRDVSPEGFTDGEIKGLGTICMPNNIVGEGSELTTSKGMELADVGNNVTLIAREGKIELYDAGENFKAIANILRVRTLGDAAYINAIKALPYRAKTCRIKGAITRHRNPDLEPLTEEEVSFVYPFSPSAPPLELQTTIPMAEAVAASAPISLPEAVAVPAPMAGNHVARALSSPSSTRVR